MKLRSVSPLALLALAAAASAQFSFTALDRDDADQSFSGAPAIDGAGNVVAQAGLSDGSSALFRYAGGVKTTVAGSADGLDFIGRFPTINEAGTVGFAANPWVGSGSRVYRSLPGGGVQELGGADFDFLDFFPSINAAGTVAFRGERLPGFVDGVYAANGLTVTPIYDETDGLDAFGSDPRLIDDGRVAFTATRTSDGEQGVFVGDGGALTTVADTAGEFSSFGDLTMNDAGDVLFEAFRDDFSSGLFLYSGGVLTTVADSNGPFSSFDHLALNDLGGIAFTASLDDGTTGLFAGSDLTNPILSSGGSFLGGSLFGFGLYRDGLNDAGELAFLAFYDDGTSALVRAAPVPEPATMAALGLGVVAMLRRRRGVSEAEASGTFAG